MTFIKIQENIGKKFSNKKKLYFNTRNSGLYFDKPLRRISAHGTVTFLFENAI